MIPNNSLRFHFLNVEHGDATIVELPDYKSSETARFGVIDFGERGSSIVTDYMRELVGIRTEGMFDNFRIEFACVTHPHEDHYGGLKKFLDEFSNFKDLAKNRLASFWDCGFRTTSSTYNNIIRKLIPSDNVLFMRLAAGSEFVFGEVRISVLAPSIDLRNRFDTYGVDKNNASIVLRFKLKNSYAIIAGDAEYESWGKIVEEFPRTRTIKYVNDALGMAERHDTADQLKCDLIRASHHGSKHGTDLRYLERIKPSRIIISAGSKKWYEKNKKNWVGMFPHPVLEEIIKALPKSAKVDITGVEGNILISYTGAWTSKKTVIISEKPGESGFTAKLRNAI